MVVHLESGIATTACEADNMVLAVIYCDGGLIDGDVIRPHIEDDSNFTLILQVKDSRQTSHIKQHIKVSRLCYTVEIYIRNIKPVRAHSHTNVTNTSNALESFSYSLMVVMWQYMLHQAFSEKVVIKTWWEQL